MPLISFSACQIRFSNVNYFNPYWFFFALIKFLFVAIFLDLILKWCTICRPFSFSMLILFRIRHQSLRIMSNVVSTYSSLNRNQGKLLICSLIIYEKLESYLIHYIFNALYTLIIRWFHKNFSFDELNLHHHVYLQRKIRSHKLFLSFVASGPTIFHVVFTSWIMRQRDNTCRTD